MGEVRKAASVTIGHKMKSKKDYILEAHYEKTKVHFATLTDIGHLKKL